MDNTPEVVKAMARSILARGYNSPDLRREVLNGAHDKSAALKDILTAIIETSELCAKLADNERCKPDSPLHRGANNAARLIGNRIRSFTHLPETLHED